MKKIATIILLFLISKQIFQQQLVFGGEYSLLNSVKISNDVINIDTNYYYGNQFYMTGFKSDVKASAPALYLEYFQKNGWIIGLRESYSEIRYKQEDIQPSGALPNIAKPSEFVQRHLSTRLYCGREFFSNKLLQPFVFAGITRYHYYYNKFDNISSISLAYNYSNYENWLKKTFSSVNTLSLGFGINFRHLGISFYHDRTLIPLNSLIHSYTNTSYCTLKYNVLSYQASKKIPLTKSNTGTKVTEQAYVAPATLGISFERPIDGGLEIAKDTVTGYNVSDVEYSFNNDATFEDGYFYYGFVMVEVRKKAKQTSLSPTLSVYYEKSIRQSRRWFVRNAISYRFFHLKYEGAVKVFDNTYYLFLSNNPANVDLFEERLSLVNEYSSITQEHKIGYRLIRGNKPNYFTLNAGIRINWTIRHWNSFTSEVRRILPMICAGITYKINRFSLGVIGERTIYAPDRNGYYRYFYGINGQINFDIYRIKQ